MANYNAVIRTNYFSVTDEKKYREIINSCSVEEEIHVFEEISSDGKKLFGFGCFGSIFGMSAIDGDDDCEADNSVFYAELQSVLAEGDAIIIVEVGYEKLRYLIGTGTVITQSDIQLVSLDGSAVNLARSLLNNPDYTPRMYY
jgi:hypothetical protein